MTRANERQTLDPKLPPVVLVGAGPGDPGLITQRGLEALGRAQVVVHDALANPVLLKHVDHDAQVIDAGKRAGRHKLSQDQINALLVDHAKQGKRVVRLKGGDPYLFGRGAEEVGYLAEHDVPSEVVPGITAGIAGPTYAGIPVTHRGVAASVTFVTGHEDPTKADSAVDYQALADLISRGNTLCIYMGVGKIAQLIDTLTHHGLSADTPAAAIQSGTLPTQHTVRTTAGDLPQAINRAQLKPPAILVIGQTAGLDVPGLRFFEQRPLFGQTVLVTRTRQQASTLSAELGDLGARVIEAPTVELVDPDDWSETDEAVQRLPNYDWLCLTSANAVATLAQRLDHLHLDSRHLAGVRIASVGKATTAALNQRLCLRPDFEPAQSSGSALAEQLTKAHSLEGKSVLLLRADIARPALPNALREAGAKVSQCLAYHTRLAQALPDQALELLRQHQIDWATFTSSSTAKNLLTLLGDERALLDQLNHASIGPVTSQTLTQLGLTVTVEAPSPGITQLAQALAEVSAKSTRASRDCSGVKS